MELSRGVFGVRGANVNIRCRGGMEECEESCKSVSMKWHDPRGNGFCVCAVKEDKILGSFPGERCGCSRHF